MNPFSRHFGSATAHLVKSEEFRAASGAPAFSSGKSRCLHPAWRPQPQAGTERIRRKTYLNPGSLGLALDDVGGHAHFAILTLENSTWQIECFQIPYDLEGYLAEFDRAELETHGSVLARSLKRTLTCGINYFYLTVKRVRNLRMHWR